MTEPMPVRKIEASQLRRANRTAPPPAPVPPTIDETPGADDPSTTQTAPVREPVAAAPAAAATPGSSRPQPQTVSEPAASKDTARMSTYLDAGVRDRARAAYKATAHLENDRSWSAFVEAALLAETIRREQAHNDSRPFPGGDQPLAPGRPIN